MELHDTLLPDYIAYRFNGYKGFSDVDRVGRASQNYKMLHNIEKGHYYDFGALHFRWHPFLPP